MRNTLALTQRILQQFSHDHRTVALFLVAPIVVLWLFSVILGSPVYEPSLVGVDLPVEVTSVLEEQEDVRFAETDAAQAAEQLANREVDAVLTLEDGILHVEVEGTEASKTSASLQAVQLAMQTVATNQREELLGDLTSNFEQMQDTLAQMSATIEKLTTQLQQVQQTQAAVGDAGQGTPAPGDGVTPLVVDVEVSYLHGSSEWGGFDFFGPVFIGIFIFVFVFLTSGIALVTERTGGTMERLLVTPIKAYQLVSGYGLGYAVMSLVQAFVVLGICIWLIGFPNEGSLVLVVFTTFTMALVSLMLGLLVSALARTPFQVIQLMLLFVVPQILLSGVFDLSQAPEWLQVLSAVFPVSHGAEALRDIMLRGAGLDQVGGNLAILWAFVAAFFALATLSFNRRKA
jgi:ABC-2 type transport system permease protein